MEIFQLFATTLIIVTAIALLGFLNKSFDLGLSDLSHDPRIGTIDSMKLHKIISEKNAEVNDLKKRIQVLEKIVTDPKEQLRREINNL